MFVFMYYVAKKPINETYVVDASGTKIGRLRCHFGLDSAIGHAFLWFLLTIVTLGVAGLIYIFRVQRVVLSATEIEWYAA